MSSGLPLRILVLYAQRFQHPLRRTIEDHLRMFEEVKRPVQVNYLNCSYGIPRFFLQFTFELAVLHPSWLAAARHPRLRVENWLQRHRFLVENCRWRIALPQDEHHNYLRLRELFHTLQIHRVYSVAPPSHWPHFYGTSPPFAISPFRTGGLSRLTRQEIDRILPGTLRDIDIAYRATSPSPRTGRLGRLKGLIAERVEKAARLRGLRTDISLDPRDTLYGRDWYHFLCRSRWVIGVEGGSSLGDADGSITRRIAGYQVRFPEASFHQVEAACFPGLDRNLDYRALSPRQLEAAACRCGQILIRGAYNDILQADQHYLPLAEDFSNLDVLLDQILDENQRRRMTEKAWQDVVSSGQADCEAMAGQILDELPPQFPCRNNDGEQTPCRKLTRREEFLRCFIPLETRVCALAKRFFPRALYDCFRAWFRSRC